MCMFPYASMYIYIELTLHACVHMYVHTYMHHLYVLYVHCVAGRSGRFGKRQTEENGASDNVCIDCDRGSRQRCGAEDGGGGSQECQ